MCYLYLLHFYNCVYQQGLTIQSSQAVANAKQQSCQLSGVTPGIFETEAPGGYKFYLEDKAQPSTGNTFFQLKADYPPPMEEFTSVCSSACL